MFLKSSSDGIEIAHVGNGRFLIKGVPYQDLKQIVGLFDVEGNVAIVEWWYLSEFMQSLKVLGYEEATVDKQETQDFIQTIRGKEEALRLLLDREKECTIPEIPEFKEKLFEIQKRGVLGLLNRRVFGLFDEMGAGKTIQAIYAFALLQKFMKRNCRMLVVCPKNVKYDWRNAFDQYLGMPVDFAEDNLKGQIVVAHFEQVIDRTIKKVVNYVETKQVIESKVFDSLKKEVFDIIVVDEGHYVKNQKSKRTRVVRELLPPRKNTEIDHVCGKIDSMNVTLSRTRPYVWFLTGTPMENSEDIYVFLKESYGKSFVRFSKFRSFFNKWEEIWVARGRKIKTPVCIQNENVLADLIANASLKRSRSEIKEIPFLEKTMELTLSKDDRCKLVEIIESQPNALAKVMKGVQFCNNPDLLGEQASAVKMEALLDVVKGTKDKVVVWTMFREAVTKIVAMLEKHGISAVPFMGGDDAEEVKAEFADKQVVVATIAKGAVGVNFMKTAFVVVYMEKPFSFTLWSQSHDRVMRVDRDTSKPVLFVILKVRNSMDKLLEETIARKTELNKLLFDSPKILEKVLEELSL